MHYVCFYINIRALSPPPPPTHAYRNRRGVFLGHAWGWTHSKGPQRGQDVVDGAPLPSLPSPPHSRRAARADVCIPAPMNQGPGRRHKRRTPLKAVGSGSAWLWISESQHQQHEPDMRSSRPRPPQTPRPTAASGCSGPTGPAKSMCPSCHAGSAVALRSTRYMLCPASELRRRRRFYDCL